MSVSIQNIMKVIKYLLIVIVSIVVVALIAALFVKKEFHFEKSVEINASKEVVWDNVVKFGNHDKWSQWKEMDPKMEVSITGTDGEVGAKMSWKSSHKDVGNGSQEITKVIPGQRVDTKLNFEGMGGATSYMIVTGDSTKSKVTWALEMEQGWPFNLMVAMFAEQGMNQMFDKGLGMLKKASE